MSIRLSALLCLCFTMLVASDFAQAQGPGFRGGRGPDKEFAADRDVFHLLLANGEKIRREVTELEDGVETVTESDDVEIISKIQEHVDAMYRRVDEGRPIRMRDPLFAEVFRHADKIEMKFEETEKGVKVTETSADPYVATLIKEHAKVVSNFVKHGFDEAHKNHPVPKQTASADTAAKPASCPCQQGETCPCELDAQQFASFDRIYIPALALTNQQKEDAAKKAVQRLSEQWDAKYAKTFHSTFENDEAWPSDLSRIAQAIAVAKHFVESGSYASAHETLEPIRDILMEARSRNQVPYALDSLSRFHAVMEEIVKPAMKPEPINDEYFSQLTELGKQADALWTVVEQTEFPAELFGLKPETSKSLVQIQKMERMAIENLNKILPTGDKQDILKAAKSLKPPFAKMYMSFGNFSHQE
ncbi:MAG: hypothetical protein KDA87_14305 [Planctomycetales bacterium]|nr:hypothetical protein [Planctomycetales bacterium]